MYNELTEVDIRKMRAEIDEKMSVLRPKLLDDVKTARAFGDLSENYEYKAAKQELRKCDSRLRYLRRMIDTARVIRPNASEGVAGLFDRVEILYEGEDETETVELVTTLRQDSLKGLISKEAPLGRAILGHRVGDRVRVDVSETDGYYITIQSITKGTDDESLPIRSF